MLLFLLAAVGTLFAVIQTTAIVMGVGLARSITGSVHALFEGTERVRRGDFTHRISIRARDQLGELAASFNSMTASVEDLLRVQAEKERLAEELRIAHEIQMSLLPQGPLEFPGVSVTSACGAIEVSFDVSRGPMYSALQCDSPVPREVTRWRFFNASLPLTQ